MKIKVKVKMSSTKNYIPRLLHSCQNNVSFTTRYKIYTTATTLTKFVKEKQKVRTLPQYALAAQNTVHCAFSCMPRAYSNHTAEAELRANFPPISGREKSHVISATQLFALNRAKLIVKYTKRYQYMLDLNSISTTCMSLDSGDHVTCWRYFQWLEKQF